ncbi:MAG TPA: poly(hydroxyalkanoate) granule-associated protein, partial [Anaerolineae bacterium]
MAPTAHKVTAEPAANGNETNPLVDVVRKVLLASIGAVALAQDEVEDFVNKLVDRGQIAEKDGRKLIKDVM